MKKNILVVSQHFYPEKFRINDICKEWTKKGHAVTVITGIPNYPKGSFYPGYSRKERKIETWNGVNIVRLNIFSRGKSRIKLFINYLSFVFSGFFWSKRTKILADIVFIFETSPIIQALPGIWYSKRKKIPAFLYVTDLWPETLTAMTGIKNKFLLKPLNLIINYIYKNSSRIFTSSKSFINSISKRNVPKKKIEYWPQYAEDLYYEKTKLKEFDFLLEIKNSFKIVFAGNVGYAQGLSIIISVLGELIEKGYSVNFIIVGQGSYLSKLKDIILQNNFSKYFTFIKPQPARMIPNIFSYCDASLISLKKNDVFSMTIPSKLQSCMASGIPIIVSADGEIQKIIYESKSGVYSDSEDSKMLTKNIIKLIKMTKNERNLMGKNGIIYSKKNFNKNLILNRMDKLMEIYIKGEQNV